MARPADTILVVDDDPTLLALLEAHLGRAGYRVISAESGPEALQAFYENRPALVVLDVMMPRMDGWTVCARLRELSDIPILLLTAKGEEKDRLRGFRLGVDDYVVKPFSFAELVARVGAILGRRQQPTPGAEPLLRGDVAIDLDARRVTRGGRPVHLTPTEFRLLEALAVQPGITVPAPALLSRVWGTEFHDDVENVKRYIHYLRQKLEANPEDPKLILTERGFGYYLAS